MPTNTRRVARAQHDTMWSTASSRALALDMHTLAHLIATGHAHALSTPCDDEAKIIILHGGIKYVNAIQLCATCDHFVTFSFADSTVTSIATILHAHLRARMQTTIEIGRNEWVHGDTFIVHRPSTLC